ncbi:nucleoside-diphosphate kinase [bacterium]|nr:nucleoside-diphosphate kinase [bacterium]
MERTLCIIKPDGVRNKVIGKIVSRIEDEQFTILGMKRIRLTEAMAQDFYSIHSERPFFGELVDYMTSGPVVVIALEHESAVNHWRTVIGATNPQDADEGTIRKLYGKDISENVVHGSDSVENGRLEISKFFTETELIAQR